jgi:hypothetical protein
MTPQTEQIRDARQDDRQQPLDLGRLVAPVLQAGLEFASFGPRAQIVRDLFREQPDIFRGTNVADGTNLPSLKNVFLFEVLEERARSIAA